MNPAEPVPGPVESEPLHTGSAPGGVKSIERITPSLSLEHLSGREIAGFRILRELGRGNNGVVYLARQLALDREVALKLLLPELAAEPDYVRSILREARLAARLDHPNIVQALDAGSSSDGYYFFAMEYVPGRTLEEIRVKQPETLTFRFLLDVSIQLADALAYAWKHCQMIHGDIKPGNLLIRDGDRLLKLADLGLARISGAQGADEIMVTPLYAAPEVIRGEFSRTGQTSDIYSFGVMFYELAAGKPPFRGNTDTLIDAHLNLPPPPLWEANPDIDPELSQFIMQMLAKDPEERPADWEKIGTFLRGVRTRLYAPGHTARRPMHPYRKSALREHSARKRPKWDALPAVLKAFAITVGLLLLGAFLYTAFRFLTEDTSLQPIMVTPQPTEESASASGTVPLQGKLKVALSGEATRTLPPPKPLPPETTGGRRPAQQKQASPPQQPLPPPPQRQTAERSPLIKSVPQVPQPQPDQIPPENVRELPDTPPERLFNPRIPVSAMRKRLDKLDRMLDQLNADDFPPEWKTQAREVGVHAWLLLLQLATRGLPIPELERFEPVSSRRKSDWTSFGGMAGFIRVYPNMSPLQVARGFGAGFYQELRKARRIPAGMEGDFSRAFEFFVEERLGRRPVRAGDNRVLRSCNYTLADFADALQNNSLGRRLQQMVNQK